MEHQRVALGLRQRRDRVGDARPERSRVDRVAHAVGEIDRRHALRGETRDRADAALLTAPVPGQQVGADPVQPRPGVRTGEVVRLPLLEGDAEHVAHERLGVERAEPADEVPVERGRVPVEDPAERRRSLERRGNHLGVGRFLHTVIFPARRRLDGSTEPQTGGQTGVSASSLPMRSSSGVAEPSVNSYCFSHRK